MTWLLGQDWLWTVLAGLFGGGFTTAALVQRLPVLQQSVEDTAAQAPDQLQGTITQGLQEGLQDGVKDVVHDAAAKVPKAAAAGAAGLARKARRRPDDEEPEPRD